MNIIHDDLKYLIISYLPYLEYEKIIILNEELKTRWLKSQSKIYYYKYMTKWIVNGKLHREDGPAIEYSDGRKKWYYNGKLYKIQYSDGKVKTIVKNKSEHHNRAKKSLKNIFDYERIFNKYEERLKNLFKINEL
jgi:hypothetical protein